MSRIVGTASITRFRIDDAILPCSACVRQAQIRGAERQWLAPPARLALYCDGRSNPSNSLTYNKATIDSVYL